MTVFNKALLQIYKISINRGMDKEGMVHMFNGILLNHKKERKNVICSNMDGHVESKKMVQMNLFTKQK